MIRLEIPFARLARCLAAAGVLTVSGCAGSPSQPNDVAAPASEPTAAAAPAAVTRATRNEAPVATYTREQPAVQLNPRHPDRYTVIRGDTLWDISTLFLRDPWLWPEIWFANPQISNPHLIFPGDVISLVFVDGKPQLRLERGQSVAASRAQGAERLSPQIREGSLDQAIRTIPYEAISAFLSRPTVLSRRQIDEAPYVMDTRGNHLVAGAGFEAYVRGDDLTNGATFSLFRIGQKYVDPDTRRSLGYSATYVGQGRITREGDPATMYLTESRREVLGGDLLLPVNLDISPNFFPRAPDTEIAGRIIEIEDGISIFGQYQVVVINKGAQDGLEPSHVLEIFQEGRRTRDPYGKSAFRPARVKLPDERAGIMMVFSTLEQISYGLVMNATSEMRVHDMVRSP